MRMSRGKPGDVAEEGPVASVVHNGGTAALREKRPEKGEIFCFEGAAGASRGLRGGDGGAGLNNTCRRSSRQRGEAAQVRP
jgi:hypothetical protein